MCESVRAETTLIDQRVMTIFRHPMRKREKTMRKLSAKWGKMRRFLRISPYRGYPMRKLISHLLTPKIIISIK